MISENNTGLLEYITPEIINRLLPGIIVGIGASELIRAFNKLYKNKDLYIINNYKKKLLKRGEVIFKMNFGDEINKLNAGIEIEEFRCIEDIKKQVEIHDKFILSTSCIIKYFESYIIGLLKNYFLFLKEKRTNFNEYKKLNKFIEISQIKGEEYKEYSKLLLDSYSDYKKVIEILMKNDSRKILSTINNLNIESKKLLTMQ